MDSKTNLKEKQPQKTCKQCVFYETVPLIGRYCKDNEVLNINYPCIFFTSFKEKQKVKER